MEESKKTTDLPGVADSHEYSGVGDIYYDFSGQCQETHVASFLEVTSTTHTGSKSLCE